MGHYLGRLDMHDDLPEFDRVLKWLEVRLDAIEAHERATFEAIADLGGRLKAVEREGSRRTEAE